MARAPTVVSAHRNQQNLHRCDSWPDALHKYIFTGFLMKKYISLMNLWMLDKLFIIHAKICCHT